jgi:hypothetical protein
MTTHKQPVFTGKQILLGGLLAAMAILAGMLAAPVPALAARADTDSARSLLASRLDSLEMVKQDKKRRGESLDELERQTIAIKDSLIVLRGAVAHQSPPVAVAAPAADSGRTLAPPQGIVKLIKQVLKPASLIDWAIIGIGAVAVVSGIFLIVSLAFASGRKKRQQARSVAQQKTFGGYSASGRPVTGPAPAVRREEPEGEESDTPVGDDEDEPAHLESTPDEDLNLLRRRVRQDNPPVQAAPPRLGAVEPTGPDTVSNDVRRQVVAAAAEGCDIAEISRRFHLSADHVALLLKVAAKKK